MRKRNTLFHGELGKYNTVWNTVVRLLGTVEAGEVKKNLPETYKNLAMYVNSRAVDCYNIEGVNVRHPDWRVPSFYGMKEELKVKLKEEKKHMVLAYDSEWLLLTIKEWLVAKGFPVRKVDTRNART